MSTAIISRSYIVIAGRHYSLCLFIGSISYFHCALQLCVLRIGERGNILYVLCDNHLVLSLEKDLVPLCLLADAHDDASMRTPL